MFSGRSVLRVHSETLQQRKRGLSNVVKGATSISVTIIMVYHMMSLLLVRLFICFILDQEIHQFWGSIMNYEFN